MTLKIVFGTSIYARGHGVSLVIDQLSKQLVDLDPDIQPLVVTFESDQDFLDRASSRGMEVVPCSFETAPGLLERISADVFIPHTDPFFSYRLKGVRTIIYEHGDPCPLFFGDESTERQLQVRSKQVNCYGLADALVVISDFQRMDLPWPHAKRIYNGCDHVPDLGPKSHLDATEKSKLFRIGILSRLQGKESAYKGFDLVRQMLPALERDIPGLSLEYCGKISAEHRSELERFRIKVLAAVSDEARNNWLRSLDVVLSPSLWEGFNLPLVESQALGTLAIAFDTGAHPEVTPFICSSVAEMHGLLVRLASDKQLLETHSKTSYNFVRSRFTWRQSGKDLLAVIRALPNRGRS